MSETRQVGRREDMSPDGRLTLFLQPDGDVILEIICGEEQRRVSTGFSMYVEFCSPAGGGGKSPNTLRALRELALAIERDNAETPTFDPLYERRRRMVELSTKVKVT